MGLQKNVASQKWIVFAFDRTNNTPKTGDAANITANLRLDGGAANAVDDTNPTELEDGYYVFDITQAEANADLILMTPVSGTANIQVIGVPGAVYTVAPNFNAMGIESDGDLTKVNLLNGHTPQTGDTFDKTAGLTNFIQIFSAMVCSHGDDSTAQSELQAAGVGGGTYDGSTDSPQANSDRAVLIKAVTDNLPDGGSLNDLATFVARLTAARAAKLDNVPAGVMPTQAEVLSIQNNTRTTFSLPQVAERPDAGSTLLKIYLDNYDTVGNMEVPDSAPTVAVANETGTTRSGNLQHPTTHSPSTTMVNLSAGRYWIEYDLDNADALESLTFTFTVIEGGVTRTFDRQMLVVDTTAVDFTAADRAKLNTLHDTRLTATRATNLDNLDAAVSSRSSHDAAAIWSVVARTLTANTNFNDPTTAAIRDALLDRLLAGNHDVAGSPGKLLQGITDVYHADVDLRIDEANTRDEWTVTWFQNGVAVTSGITAPTLQVVKRADSTDLIASTAMSQIGSIGSYKLDDAVNRTTAGEAAIAIAGATIDGAARSFRVVIGRDSTA